MAFFKTVLGGLETAVHSIEAGFQLGLNKKANNAVKRSADKTKKSAATVGQDIGGFATNTVAPALQTAGHEIAVKALEIVDLATSGKNKDVGKARDHHKRQAKKAARNAEAGWNRLTSHSTEWCDLSGDGAANNKGQWLASIKSDTKLNGLYLPGTHDSIALIGGDFTECQKWNLLTQLLSGIRVLDIRCRRLGRDLPIHHGVVYQEKNMLDVMKVLAKFLQDNPKETILARISTSGCGDAGSDFEDLVCEKAAQCNVRLVKQRDGMSLGECRGKLVLIDHTDKCDIQDQWQCADIDQKFGFIKRFAEETGDTLNLLCNYANATGFSGIAYLTPAGIAGQINKRIYQELDRPARPMIIMLDYPGQGLVNKIIDFNKLNRG